MLYNINYSNWRKAEWFVKEKNLIISAKVADWHLLHDCLRDFMKKLEIPNKIINHIIIASEEIFVNISNYAYPNSLGYVKINIIYIPSNGILKIKFTDEGIPFDPTSVRAPNIKEKIENRKIGGLGIFIVNKLMDRVEYVYLSGKNNLTIIKKTK